MFSGFAYKEERILEVTSILFTIHQNTLYKFRAGFNTMHEEQCHALYHSNSHMSMLPYIAMQIILAEIFRMILFISSL